jgi:hypothetical protein
MVVPFFVASMALATSPAASQQRAARSTIHTLDERTASQIAALDRQRTIFILPVGMLEPHGPHLPIGADTLAVGYEAGGAARRVARDLAGWSIVMMPAVNYRQSGANRLGDQRYHPGTYSTRRFRAGPGHRSTNCAASRPVPAGRGICISGESNDGLRTGG